MNELICIDHVQVTVPSECEAKAREFYCGLLELKEVEKPENRKSKGGFWVAIGGGQIHVSLEDGVERLRTRAHVAYRVADLDFWRDKFAKAEIKISESLPFPNARAFELRDPFGNRIEIIEVF